MTHITKKSLIEGRPYFSSNEEDKTSPTSFFRKNSQFKKLDPSISPSKIQTFFRKLWKSAAPYFSIQHPSAVKQNIAFTAHPLDSSPFTIGNLWNHYRDFIIHDRDCPKSAKAAFESLKKDEKVLKAPLSPSKKKAFLRKTSQEVDRLKQGKTRLFILQRKQSLDQSMDGELIGSITRTKDGYTIEFTGSGDVMLELNPTLISLAGKEKIHKSLKCENIPLNDPILNELLKGWVEPEGITPHKLLTLINDRELTPVYDNLQTKSDRADQVFWNIMEGFTQKPSERDQKSVIRDIHLRADLLTLYKVFKNARSGLDPETQEYQDLTKLFEEVSAKVFIAYKKKNLSKNELKTINSKLVLIDATLQLAKQKSSSTLHSKISLKNQTFKNDSLKEKYIKIPQIVSANLPEFSQLTGHETLPIGEIDLTGLESFSLEMYSSIGTPAEFMDQLAIIHQLRTQLDQGTITEKKQAYTEIFRFFSEAPFHDLTVKNPAGELLPNEYSLGWKFNDDEMKQTMEMIVEIIEEIAKDRVPESISQYDLQSLHSMEMILELFNARLHSTLWYQMPNIFVESSFKRYYQRPAVKYHYQGLHLLYPFNKDLLNLARKESLYIRNQDAIDKILYNQTELEIFWKGRGEIFDFFDVATQEKWIRPIHNPHLLTLYKRVCLEVNNYSGARSPEAFHSNPEEVLNYFLEQENVLNEFSPMEIKALSRLLRTDSPHEELIAFMHEWDHLLLNPEIRNFFDALFFGMHLKILGNDAPEMYPRQITNEISKLITAISENKKDSTLQKNQIELLLYYSELNIKLKEFYVQRNLPIDDFFPRQEELLQLLCARHYDSSGYAARVLLRELLFSGTLDETTAPNVLITFADAYGSQVDPMNVEPYFEEAMNRHWQAICQALKTQNLEASSYTSLIERFFYNKNIALDGSDWKQTDPLIFQNDHYELNLNTWNIRFLGATETLEFLPGTVLSDSHIKAALPNEKLPQVQAIFTEIKGVQVYSFKDSDGIPIQIEVSETGPPRLYKKISLSGTYTWLESVPIHSEKKINLKNILALIKNKGVKPDSSLALFNKGLYLDPRHPKKGYILSKNGTLDFEVTLSHSKGAIKVVSLTDCRLKPSTGPWKVGNASKNKSLDFLKKFESPDEIILWSKHGHLKKIEMPHYGLTFALENGKLKCLTAPFEGYAINPNATLKERKGFTFSLLLEHPDPKNQKKLLLPSTKAITNTQDIQWPKAKGLAKLSLGAYYVKAIAKRKSPKIVFQENLTLTSGDENLPYTYVDLRSETSEIIKKRTHWPETSFHLIQHAALTNQPLLAHRFLKKFPYDEAIKDQKLFQEIVQFCQQGDSGPNAAIQAKLALNLINALKRNKKLTTSLKTTLESVALDAGKRQLAAGRRVPGALELTGEEGIHFSRIAEKHDPEYFKQHLLIYFAGEDVELGAEINTEDTHWAEELATWKAARKEMAYKKRVAKLDADLDVKTQLSSDEIRSSLPLVEDKTPLLFTKDELKGLFSSKTVTMDRIELDASHATESYKQVALKEFQEDLDRYHADATKRETHQLKANKKSLDRFMRTKIVPKQMAYEQE